MKFFKIILNFIKNKQNDSKFDKNGKLQGEGYYFIQKQLGKINSFSK